MLARLREIPGVDDARVECSGTYFLVEAGDAAAQERALPAIREILGASARRVDGAERAAQLATRSRGEPWFSRDDVRALSYVEARLLSARTVDAVQAALALDAAATERLLEATRLEIVAALDHAHDTGGRRTSGWFWLEWPAIARRIAAREAVPSIPAPDLERALLAQGQR